jgi:uncharacterized protein involved in exopolysaccharide biosynthesis
MGTPDARQSFDSNGELGLRGLVSAIRRRWRAIVGPTLLAFVGLAIFVHVVSPRYTAETRVLLENQETYFTRPDRPNLQPEQAAILDTEAVASQVDLITSYDLARHAIDLLKLKGNPEFDPLAGGFGPIARILILLGVTSDATRESADQRVVTKFLDRLTVFSPPKTRIITIQFSSRDPELAARAANLVAKLYLQEQAAAKRARASLAADALQSEIADLKTKLVAADDDLQKYRLKTGLLAGSNNVTISSQQLTEINTDLSNARARQADAQAKASLIRELLQSGHAANIIDVINNDLVRRISEQRVTAQAELALELRSLLPGHPRIKALTAQVQQYDLALKMAAKETELSLENEAKIAAQRVANLESALAQQKTLAGSANFDEVHLRALQRIADAYKDQLESASSKYQEALARETSIATPSDARVISTASRPQEPSFPRKIPIIGFGTVVAFLLSTGLVITGELLSEPVVEMVPVHTIKEQTVEERPAPVEPAQPVQPERPRRVATRREARSDRDGSDPVFAPVDPERQDEAERRRLHATGGMLSAILDHLRKFGRSAAESRRAETVADDKADPSPPVSDAGSIANRAASAWSFDGAFNDASRRPGLGPVAERIVAAHVPGRGLHIVGAATDSEEASADAFVGLARSLSVRGRAILVDLNRTPLKLASLAAEGEDGRTKILGQRGLAELLVNEATFAEVIHRDHSSRLHYIPSGLRDADFHDFDLILDALGETYDFVLMLAPNYSLSEITKILAPYSDFVILMPSRETDAAAVASIKTALLEAGAREVLVAGATQSSQQDVA